MNTDVRAEMAEQLFGAIQRGDYAGVHDLWAEDVTVWHSGDERDNDRVRALKVIKWFINVTDTRSYEILDRQFFDNGFVQQHILRAGRSDGPSIEMRVCIVIKLGSGGLITRIDEYFDPKEMSALL